MRTMTGTWSREKHPGKAVSSQLAQRKLYGRWRMLRHCWHDRKSKICHRESHRECQTRGRWNNTWSRQEVEKIRHLQNSTGLWKMLPCVEYGQGGQEVHQKLSCSRSQMPASLKHKPGYQPLFSVVAVKRYLSQGGTKNHGSIQTQSQQAKGGDKKLWWSSLNKDMNYIKEKASLSGLEISISLLTPHKTLH